ncbi:MAG: hypothetical protein DMF49_04850 [Acidobacteria bacterium]|nr:MAG: hypothetical protein DMF49_04850 [Acidobacteriota bacterium]
MSVREHRERAPGMAGIAIVTVSDTRTRETDQSGAFIRACCEAAGHRITDYRILPDEPERISALLGDLIGRTDTDAVILSGGTGISGRDRTHEAICSVIERRLDGFGELGAAHPSRAGTHPRRAGTETRRGRGGRKGRGGRGAGKLTPEAGRSRISVYA